jgi:aminoglycoside phosphotransferase family enzyme
MSPAETSQQAVVDFLGDPATHGGAQVTRIVTHAARVFLAGPRALKIKCAVRFPFLDYSTLAKRKAACEAEIEVNRALAPAIYRGAVAITREADGSLAIGGAGEPVEWAVEMRRFDETQTLDHLAEAGKIDGGLADALGRAVAQAHAAAPVVTSGGFIDTLAEIVAQNDAELRASPALFPPPAVSALNDATRSAFEHLRPLLAARERAGLVRRCHGDLHLGNIALLDVAPVLFDAIEFDPALATGDVLYDLAFLLMDLIERALRQPANIVLNRYLMETRRTEDLDARGDPRQGHRGARSARWRNRAKRTRLFRSRRKTAGTAEPLTGGGRRVVGHWQVAAGARTGGRLSPRAGRSFAAQRCRAQGPVRRH